jgi:signal peptidase II
MLRSTKSRLFWPLLAVAFLTDCTTKELAVESLSPPGVPHEVVGDAVRLTLAYNQGAAMSLPLGPYAKPVLGMIAVAMSVFLLFWYRRIAPDARVLPAAIALLMAGGLGNAWGRLLSSRGVVDFIDLGVGGWRFYLFNVADVAVFVGGGLLALAFWREERAGDSAPV